MKILFNSLSTPLIHLIIHSTFSKKNSFSQKILLVWMVFLAFILPYNLIGQNIEYARSIIDTLASNEMHGRGYVQYGDRRAADFISKEFKRIGLKPYQNDYFQSFDFSVNTFPTKMELSLNGVDLKPGVDYLIDPSSPKIRGKFKLIKFSAQDVISDRFASKVRSIKKNQLVSINFKEVGELHKSIKVKFNERLQLLQNARDIKVPGIAIFSDKRLTWSASQYENVRPLITIKKKIPEENAIMELDIQNEFIPKYTSQNVVGYIEGTEQPDSILIFSAHYDHLGRMGIDTCFPGANDNASGVALLLDLVRQYSLPENRPSYSMVFIAFGGEELGLLGSRYFVKNPYFPLKKVKFMLNFDISGTGDDGIQVVNGSVFKKDFSRLQRMNAEHNLLKQVKTRGEACNSDHCFFYREGVPSFFIYTLGGIQAYHDVHDKSETLPLTEYQDYFRLIGLFISGL